MKKCLHVLFMIAALSLTFTACAGQIDEEADEKEEKTEKVTEPESPSPETQTPATQNPENQGQGQGQNPEDPEQGQGQGQGGTDDPNGTENPNNQQQDPAPVFDRFKFEQILITRTEELLSGESKLDDFIKEPAKSYVDSSKPEPYYVNCTLTFGGGEPLACKIKVRGNWTTSYAKKSLRIKFSDKQNILGLHGGKPYKNWVLLAGWKDASFLRDAAGFTMFKTMFPDYYCSDFRLVEVLLKTDDIDTPENLGIYLLAEQQEGKSGRINISEAKEENSTDTKIGYILEMDSYCKYEDENQKFYLDNYGEIKTYNGKKAGGLTTGYTIKNDMYSATQRDFIKNYMNKLWKICYNAAYKNTYYRFNNTNDDIELYTPEGNTNDERAQNCVAQVIDLTSLANTYIFNEIVCDPDLYYSSFYMDIDFKGSDHRLRFEAPWDFDSTMGNKCFCANSTDSADNFMDNTQHNRFTIESMYAGNGQPDVNGSYSDGIRVNPWLVIFIRSAWFQKLVKEAWDGIHSATLQSEVSAVIDNYTNSEDFTAAFAATRDKWGVYDKIKTPSEFGELNTKTQAAAQTSQAAAAAYLREWLIARIDAVGKIIDDLETPQN